MKLEVISISPPPPDTPTLAILHVMDDVIRRGGGLARLLEPNGFDGSCHLMWAMWCLGYSTPNQLHVLRTVDGALRLSWLFDKAERTVRCAVNGFKVEYRQPALARMLLPEEEAEALATALTERRAWEKNLPGTPFM